ncbi:MAG: aspartate/glutamate racemase family protein, partial [Asticcacaulis sp.]
MRRIGLLGGMSWESTATYYRLINEGVRERLGGLASADIVMRSLDFRAVVALQKADRWDEAAQLLGKAAQGLERAGADCILICTNTMHLVAGEVAQACDIPLIHIIDETAKALMDDGRGRPLLLATRYTMEHGFYAGHMAASGLDVLTPDGDERLACHNAIFDELCQGIVTEGSRQALIGMTRHGRDRGADSVILGCTELGLCVGAGDLCLPVFDSTRLHADAAVRFALNGETPPRQDKLKASLALDGAFI